MTENQLNKLKGRLLNVQTQINGASILLSKNEPACTFSDIHAKTTEVPYCWHCGADMREVKE